MAILKILQEPNRVLRQKAKEIAPGDIKSPKIKKLISDMSETLSSIDIGIGLAAPQVGESLSIFLVSEEALLTKRDKDNLDEEALRKSKSSKKWKHLVFINPKVVKFSKKNELLAEGCLSVENVYGKVRRFEKLTVEAWDETGKKIKRGASGLFAQVIQHETDHLNGILFIDKAEELKKHKENGEKSS